jgi:Xaa-Pro aminopeptidase
VADGDWQAAVAASADSCFLYALIRPGTIMAVGRRRQTLKRRIPASFRFGVTKSSFTSRRKNHRALVKKAEAEALLVTNFHNVTYLTGFTGDDSYLLITLDGETLITDPRYTTQLEEECPGLALEIRPPGMKMLDAIVKVIADSKADRLAIEGNSATVSFQQSLIKAIPKAQMVATENLVERLRMVKDKDEVEA